MEKGHELIQTPCLNCGASIEGGFCHQCGQSARDNTDRSLGQLLGDFFSNVFFLDNRFLISLWYILRYPGRMTVEFIEGKRKKYISPVTLFLFINLIYFLVSPLTDYSISFYDQLYDQPYSGLIREWLELRLHSKGLDIETYSATYQNMSDDISKSIMILNIPIIALFVYLMAFKKRRFYYDSLIFAFHYFTLYIASWVMLDWVDSLIFVFAGHYNSLAADISQAMFFFYIPLLYAILSIKKFMNIRWYWAIPAGMGIIVAVVMANLIYRFIILLLTIWAT